MLPSSSSTAPRSTIPNSSSEKTIPPQQDIPSEEAAVKSDSEEEEEPVPKPSISVTSSMRTKVRKAITNYLVKNHKHSVRYGSRPNDFYIYRPHPPGVSPHDSSLLIARAMPALIDYLNENPTYREDCKVRITDFSVVLQESAYRAYRRRVNARLKPKPVAVKEIKIHPTVNVGQILHSKRKRKKTVNYAMVRGVRARSARI